MSANPNTNLQRLTHGGRVNAAAAAYGIAPAQWIDLSTGIAPDAWPAPKLPGTCWTRLSEDDDGLVAQARKYYGAAHILPVAGSQAAIRALPRLREPCRVGVLAGSYGEHALAWQMAGHTVRHLNHDEIGAAITELDVLIVINPDNPSALQITSQQLVKWHSSLSFKGGWLIVDEAFIDTTPEMSLAPMSHQTGLIVLRSFGKFFGLAGARVGFVCAHQGLLDKLDMLLGPWTIATPSRGIAVQALADEVWHIAQRKKLLASSQWLRELLTKYGLSPAAGCALFQYVLTPNAKTIHHSLARRGVLTRLFDDPAALRIGLPSEGIGWARLEMALLDLCRTQQRAHL